MKCMRNDMIAVALLLFLNVYSVSASEVTKPVQIIHLTQTNCQFIEAENGLDHHFSSLSSDDCKALNRETSEHRLLKSTILRLKAGDYLFRVKNRDVPYQLGFWLRGSGLSRLILPSVSGGGIAVGETKDYAIALERGEYIYSCPLNPTPDYILIVE